MLSARFSIFVCSAEVAMKKWSLIILGMLVGLVAFMYAVGAKIGRASCRERV